MERLRRGAYTFLIVTLLLCDCKCYEKIFRKVVRDKTKMVSKPFSSLTEMVPRNSTSISSGILQRATLFTPSQNHNISLYRTQHSRKFIAAEKKFLKTTISVVTLPKSDKSNRTDSGTLRSSAADNYFIRETPSMLDYPEHNEDKQAAFKGNTQVLPREKNVTSVLFKSKMKDLDEKDFKSESPLELQVELKMDPGFSGVHDFVLEERPNLGFSEPHYSYNVTQSICTCSLLKEAVTDIDLQEKFTNFDLVSPSLYPSRRYWNSNYDVRYETLMRDNSWPPLHVILVPRTHVDTIWKQTFNQYHKNLVHKILSNIVRKLNYYENLTFSWNEVSHLSQWWTSTTHKNRVALRRLVKSGRLEITTGGWVESDEATTHLYGLVHQLIEGHEWLKNNLNISPKVGWLTNSVTHSPTMPYLLSLAGIFHFVFTKVHYAWEIYLAEFQYSDFIWVQNWDSQRDISSIFPNGVGTRRVPRSSVLAHFLQFNSDGVEACGPDRKVCSSDLNFAKINKNMGIKSYNLKEKSELLLEQLSKTGTISHHNVVLMPVGGAFSYNKLTEFDFQYDNYKKIADFINSNKNVYKASIEFGTTADYFKASLERSSTFPTVKGDFMNFAEMRSGPPVYWSGMFTSRPMVKILLRRLEASLRTAEILFTFAVSNNVFDGHNATRLPARLLQARLTLARLMDRNVSSGTLTSNAIRFVYSQILIAIKNCWAIQEMAASMLSAKPEGSPQVHLQKYLYREGEFTSEFRSVAAGDALYVFNSQGRPRTELLELVAMTAHVRLLDHFNRDVLIQVTPMWKFSSKMIRISRRFFRIVFIITVPPMTFQMFRIKEAFDKSTSAASVICSECTVEDITNPRSRVPFVLLPVKPGDIQIENYRYRFVIDEETGFLKTVIEKQTNKMRSLRIDYKAFQSSKMNAGMFVFSTNSSKPMVELFHRQSAEGPRALIIISGSVSTEVTLVCGRLLQHTLKVFNQRDGPLSEAIYVESLLDYEASPKNRDLELFLSVQTSIANGINPELYTDTNGFQYSRRMLNINNKVEWNTYPITTMAFIQDRSSRLTLVSDHAQGVTALREGQLVAVLDRRVLYDDARGSAEGLANSGATCHRHYLLLEPVLEAGGAGEAGGEGGHHDTLTLPSHAALSLSDSLTYPLDTYLVDRNETEQYYMSVPLVKSSFPRDVSVVTYRAVVHSGTDYTVTSALLLLHRPQFACSLPYPRLCTQTDDFYLHKVLRHVKNAYITNLSGTNKGVKVTKLDKRNFAPMELIALRIHF